MEEKRRRLNHPPINYTMIHHNIQEYLDAKERYDMMLSRIDKRGVMRVFVKGKWVLFEEFRSQNSKPTYEYKMKDNPDGTNIPRGVVPPKSSKAAKYISKP